MAPVESPVEVASWIKLRLWETWNVGGASGYAVQVRIDELARRADRAERAIRYVLETYDLTEQTGYYDAGRVLEAGLGAEGA